MVSHLAASLLRSLHMYPDPVGSADTWESEEVVTVFHWSAEAEEVVRETHRKAAKQLEDLVLGSKPTNRTRKAA